MNWKDKTHMLLKERPAWMSYARIAKDTELSKSWIEKFAQNWYLDPRISKVNILHDYLKRNRRSFE